MKLFSFPWEQAFHAKPCGFVSAGDRKDPGLSNFGTRRRHVGLSGKVAQGSQEKMWLNTCSGTQHHEGHQTLFLPCQGENASPSQVKLYLLTQFSSDSLKSLLCWDFIKILDGMQAARLLPHHIPGGSPLSLFYPLRYSSKLHSGERALSHCLCHTKE